MVERGAERGQLCSGSNTTSALAGPASVYCTHHRVFYNVCQCDDVGATSQILQNLYFTLDFLLLYWLKG